MRAKSPFDSVGGELCSVASFRDRRHAGELVLVRPRSPLIEAQFTTLRYFALYGTDYPSHKAQAGIIRRYIIWRSNHACDERLGRAVDRA